MDLKRIIRSLDQDLVHQRSRCLSLKDMTSIHTPMTLLDGQDLREKSDFSDATKIDWLVTAVSNKGGMRAMVDVLARKETIFPNFIHRLGSILPNETQVRTDLTLLKGLSLTPSHQELESLLVNFEIFLADLPENSISECQKCLIVAFKVANAIWDKLRSSDVLRPWTESYQDLKKSLKVYVDRFLADQMIQRQRGRLTHRALPITTRSQPAEETPTSGGNSQTQNKRGKDTGKGKGGRGRGRGREG